MALEPGRYPVQYQPAKGPSQGADFELAAAAMVTLPFAAFKTQTARSGFPKGTPFQDGITDVAEVTHGAPAAPEAGSVGLWDRMGYAFWGGAGGFEDKGLDKGLRTAPDVDRHFGTTGAFAKPDLKSEWGFDMTWAVGAAWTVGARFGFSEGDYSLQSIGREPLNSVPDSLRDRYPVKLSWDYSVSDIRFGAFMGRAFRLNGFQSLFAEAGAAFLSRSMSGERVLERPLYQAISRNSSDIAADGYRLEAGLTYRLTLPGRFIGKGLAFGLRVSPYATLVSGMVDESGTDLSADELGCTAAITFNLLGRNARAIPRSMP